MSANAPDMQLDSQSVSFVVSFASVVAVGVGAHWILFYFVRLRARGAAAAAEPARLAAQGCAITEQSLSGAMALAHVPDPDLVIRTGGEQRVSNFLLWQSAYSEFYFSDKLWPEFDAAALGEAIDAFAQRERRFGKTSEQVLQDGAARKAA